VIRASAGFDPVVTRSAAASGPVARPELRCFGQREAEQPPPRLAQASRRC
jgi:hypothetical protein